MKYLVAFRHYPGGPLRTEVFECSADPASIGFRLALEAKFGSAVNLEVIPWT